MVGGAADLPGRLRLGCNPGILLAARCHELRGKHARGGSRYPAPVVDAGLWPLSAIQLPCLHERGPASWCRHPGRPDHTSDRERLMVPAACPNPSAVGACRTAPPWRDPLCLPMARAPVRPPSRWDPWTGTASPTPWRVTTHTGPCHYRGVHRVACHRPSVPSGTRRPGHTASLAQPGAAVSRAPVTGSADPEAHVVCPMPGPKRAGKRAPARTTPGMSGFRRSTDRPAALPPRPRHHASLQTSGRRPPAQRTPTAPAAARPENSVMRRSNFSFRPHTSIPNTRSQIVQVLVPSDTSHNTCRRTRTGEWVPGALRQRRGERAVGPPARRRFSRRSICNGAGPPARKDPDAVPTPLAGVGRILRPPALGRFGSTDEANAGNPL